MNDERNDTWPAEGRHDPDAGPALDKANEGYPAPPDLRDTYGNAGPSAGAGLGATNVDVEMPEGGPYPLPEVVERPFAAQDPGAVRQPTVDPSLSRAVDRAAAGMDPEASGYDRSAEGPSPGPLAPEADDQPAGAEGEPSGQWGSSGSRP